MEAFVQIDFYTALHIAMLGFVGGVLSGFIGIGGAFFMTPGLMNMGVAGIVGVGSTLAQRFGQALMGARQHRELGNVDRKLGLLMLISALVGIRLASWVNSQLFSGQQQGRAASDLYISAIYVVVLSVVAVGMLRDLFEKKSGGPSTKLAEACSRLRLPPVLYFSTADIRISLWLVLAVGLFTGFLAGAIGAGGYVGVPAMIYIFGVPTFVAAGTQLFLAAFMTAAGALAYAWDGYVDLRITLLLLVGSLLGVFLGTYGTKVLKERVMRLITGLIILICVISRAIDIPRYLSHLDVLSLSSTWESILAWSSRGVLFTGGLAGAIFILVAVWRGYRLRRRVQGLLQQK